MPACQTEAPSTHTLAAWQSQATNGPDVLLIKFQSMLNQNVSENWGKKGYQEKTSGVRKTDSMEAMLTGCNFWDTQQYQLPHG